MATAGPNNPSTLADNSGTGTLAWSNPGNAATSNDSYASAAVASGAGTVKTHYLDASVFGFTIPADATINGITIEIERKRAHSSSNVKDATVQFTRAAGEFTETSTNKADTASNYPTADAYATYGGSTDLWGLAWTPTQINGGFNFQLATNITKYAYGTQTAYVDHIRMTVTYTEASTAKTVRRTLLGVGW